MKLSMMLSGLTAAGCGIRIIKGSLETEAAFLTADSRKVTEGSVFVCIVGAVSDGHNYIDQVIEKNPAAIVTQRDCVKREYPDNITVVEVDNTRKALAYMSASYFGNPAERLFTIGITGTKGKTTTTYMIRNVLEACGIKTGLIGTIETIIGENTKAACNTTPESYEIHKSFKAMADAGCKAVVMEVSSQGLKLDRTAGIMFDIGVFTNIEPDHIGPDEHESFEEYLNCKAMLFRQCKIGIVNGDDKHTKDIIANAVCPIEKYGLEKDNDLRAADINLLHKRGQIGLTYKCQGVLDMNVELNLPGKFSVYNSLCAIAVTRHLNVDEAVLKNTLKAVKVKGRIELVKVSDRFSLMIERISNVTTSVPRYSRLRFSRSRISLPDNM
ncbi:MAG: UDP-N-acetylmuramyl-tripeptide synthetase [Eubacteriales bacterium]|nr:UDP-N-acetylmuramyl-tripeptide synthetase [Eubacteriales bacterium]